MQSDPTIHIDSLKSNPATVLRSRGFAICKPDPTEKKPTYTGWSKRSLEPGDFSDGDQIGILGGPLSDGDKPGHALIIIDLDSPEAVQLADEYLPDTGMSEGRVSKPRAHRYYLVPVASIPPWAVSEATAAAPAAKDAKGHAGPRLRHFARREGAGGIDFIGTGGQVVCPPSLHESGECREWDGGEPGEPAVVPFGELWDAVVELAVACDCNIPDVMPRPSAPLAPRQPCPEPALVQRRARAYVARLPAAVSGQKGHGAMFRACRAVLWGFDLDHDTAAGIIRDHYNPRCDPPFSERDLQHKVTDAGRCGFSKPRGYLRDAAGNAPKAPRPTMGAPPPVAPDGASEAPKGAAVILDYFRETYRPVFKRANVIVSADGREVQMGEACAVPTSALLNRLATTTDAPRYAGNQGNLGDVKVQSLPTFFKTWAKVAWGDLRAELPDEDSAELGDDAPAREEFRRLVREALLSEVVLGGTMVEGEPTQVMRCSLIDWCWKFAKVGPWRSIRSKKCWCKCVPKPPDQLVLMVAIRHELFSQLKADRRLSEMGANTFGRRAERYGVGKSDRRDRPHGQSAIILDPEFLCELAGSGPTKDEDEEVMELEASDLVA